MKTPWPLRIVVIGALVFVGGLWLFPAAKTALIIAFALVVGWALWSFWDATRGATHALEVARETWRDALGAVANGHDLHLMEDGQPLIVRLAHHREGTAAAVLTPLSETTTAFRIFPRAMPRPSFDGVEPAFGGPDLQALPIIAARLGGAFTVEGNEPTRLVRWLDDALVTALLSAEAQYPGHFRGLTFDGRFLAVHFLATTSEGVGARPLETVSAASPLWRPFVPRLPSALPSLMH